MLRKRFIFFIGGMILCLASMTVGLVLNISGHAHAINPASAVRGVANQASHPSFEVVNSIYYGSNGSSIYALNATSGALIWKYQPGGYTQETLLGIQNGVAYAGLINWSAGPNTQVAALKATSGALLWLSSQTIPGLIDSLQVVNGTILIHATQVSAGDGLIALMANNGSLLWNYMVGELVSVPVIGQSVIYVNSAASEGPPNLQICELNLNNGSARWCYSNAYLAEFTQGIIYADAFSPSAVIALNASSGSLLWSNSGVASIIGVQTIVFASGNIPNTLCELNASNGSQLWCASTLGPVNLGTNVIYTYSTSSSTNQNSTEALNVSNVTTLWLNQNTNFVSAYQGMVYAIDASNNFEEIKGSTGAVLWQHNLGTKGIASNSPAINGLLYYLGSDSHSFFALNATNGVLMWQHTFYGSPQLPTVVNNIAYISTSRTVNGKQVIRAFAFNATNGALLWSH